MAGEPDCLATGLIDMSPTFITGFKFRTLQSLIKVTYGEEKHWTEPQENVRFGTNNGLGKKT